MPCVVCVLDEGGRWEMVSVAGLECELRMAHGVDAGELVGHNAATPPSNSCEEVAGSSAPAEYNRCLLLRPVNIGEDCNCCSCSAIADGE